MRKAERNRLNMYFKGFGIAINAAEVVMDKIRKNGPAFKNGEPAYRVGSRQKDPVAILIHDWPMSVGPAIDSDAEHIEKLHKKWVRQLFGNNADAWHYATFEKLLTELQNAHDEAFANEEDVPGENMEEFMFRVREIKRELAHRRATIEAIL